LNKNVLAQYDDLLREKKEVEQRIANVKADIRKIEEEGEVTDMVVGGYGGTQHFTITGYPVRDITRKKAILRHKEIILNGLKNEIEAVINDVQAFINGIEDSHVRRIVSMRYIDGMTWRQIACNIGGGNSEDAVRKTVERYLDREN
jgi:hypothetical protein